MSTRGVVPNNLVARTLLLEWKMGSTNSLNIFVRTIFMFSKVSLSSFFDLPLVFYCLLLCFCYRCDGYFLILADLLWIFTLFTREEGKIIF